MQQSEAVVIQTATLKNNNKRFSINNFIELRHFTPRGGLRFRWGMRLIIIAVITIVAEIIRVMVNPKRGIRMLVDISDPAAAPM